MNPLIRKIVQFTVVMLWCCIATPSFALDLHQKYEGQIVEWALTKSKLSIDSAPNGKIIDEIVIVRENVIAPSDPWPMVMNILHVKTRDYIIRQELLVHEGETWDEARVRESERNLRDLSIIAVAQLVPCRAASPNRVVLLVVTKDLWSLRFNTKLQGTFPIIQSLDMTPTEGNFMGHNKKIGLRFSMRQFDLSEFTLRDRISFGASYLDPRLLGTRLQVSHQFTITLDGKVPCGGFANNTTNIWCPTRSAGSPSGMYAELSVGQPLFSLASEWGFSAGGAVSIGQVRRYRRNSDTEIPLGEQKEISLVAIRFKHPDGTDVAVPHIYDTQSLSVSAGIARRFGERVKHTISWGVAAYRNQYDTVEHFPFDEATVQSFRNAVLPRSESAGYFYLVYDTNGTEYVRLRNIDSFAFTEDFLLGHNVSVEFRFANNLADALQSFITASISASYLWYVHNTLFKLGVGSATRWMPGLKNKTIDGPWVNSTFSTSMALVSPLFWIGRIHAAASLSHRDRDLNHGIVALGANQGLRGFSDEQFQGQNIVRANVEYRSLPINVWTLHGGFVLFYDGGAVYGENPLAVGETLPVIYHHSVGTGLRLLFPQFDKTTFRLDFGLSLPSSSESFAEEYALSFGFGQLL